MKKGFTLAEVLITLAIIGIVAALTIPTVVHKYQQKAQYTAFMKMYNMIQNVFQLTTVENGSFKSWVLSSDLEPDELFNTYLAPYLKIASSEDLPTYTTRHLDGAELGAFNVLTGASPGHTTKNYILQDGSTIAMAAWISNIDYRGGQIVLVIDTNGKKGPNVVGRDIFDIEITGENANRDYNIRSLEETGDDNDACSVTGSGGANHIKGIGCADRLLKEGKMDY